MQPVVIDRVAWSVGLSVTIVSPAKMAEPTKMPNRSRCHLGCGFGWAQGIMCQMGFQIRMSFRQYSNGFQSYGLSAVDISSNILSGHEGTAIPVCKSTDSLISVNHSDESRILGIKMSTTTDPLLLITVYMPTSYGDEYSLESYCKLHALIADSDTVHTIIAGSFSSSSKSRFLPTSIACSEVRWMFSAASVCLSVCLSAQ